MTYMEFKELILEKFKEENEVCSFEDDQLLINYKTGSCSVDLRVIYNEEPETDKIDTHETYIRIMNVIRSSYNVVNTRIDFDFVYPLIRPKFFCDDHELFHQDLFLDLDLYLVEDFKKGLIRFVRMDEVGSEGDKLEKAFDNLNKIKPYLQPLIENESIYYCLSESGLSSSYILTDYMQKHVESILGKDFLLLISENSSFIVAKNNSLNYNFLINVIEDPEFDLSLTNKIYQSLGNGDFSFAEKKDI